MTTGCQIYHLSDLHQQLEDHILTSRALRLAGVRAQQLSAAELVSLSAFLLISKEAKAVVYYVGLRLLIMKSGIAWNLRRRGKDNRKIVTNCMVVNLRNRKGVWRREKDRGGNRGSIDHYSYIIDNFIVMFVEKDGQKGV